MIAYVERGSYGVSDSPLAAGIIWNGAYPEFDYTIRMNVTDSIETGKDFPAFDYYRKSQRSETDLDQCWLWDDRGRGGWMFPATEAGSCAERFTATPYIKVQHYMVDSFLINKVSIASNGSPPDFYVKPSTAGFPSSEYVVVPFWEYLGGFFSTMIYLSFILTFYNTLKQLTEEKELKLTEGLKMMGVTDLQVRFCTYLQSLRMRQYRYYHILTRRFTSLFATAFAQLVGALLHGELDLYRTYHGHL